MQRTTLSISSRAEIIRTGMSDRESSMTSAGGGRESAELSSASIDDQQAQRRDEQQDPHASAGPEALAEERHAENRCGQGLEERRDAGDRGRHPTQPHGVDRV